MSNDDHNWLRFRKRLKRVDLSRSSDSKVISIRFRRAVITIIIIILLLLYYFAGVSEAADTADTSTFVVRIERFVQTTAACGRVL
jgi:hypothetical protein